MKINRESVTSQIYNDLREKISSGQYCAGEKLPSENDLAAEYGVSRLSVRGALQRLAALGIIEIRVGEGSFVKEVNFAPLIDELTRMLGSDDLMGDFLEFRITIETAGARLALSRASDEELSRLVQTARDMIQISRGGDEEAYIDYEYRFHSSIVKLGHNRIYALLYNSIENLFKETIRKNISRTREMLHEDIEEDSRYHLRVALLLQKRDPRAIEELQKIIDISPDSPPQPLEK